MSHSYDLYTGLCLQATAFPLLVWYFQKILQHPWGTIKGFSCEIRSSGRLKYLVDFKDAINLTAFILLFLHLLCKTLPLTLLDGVSALERPSSPPVRLPYVITSVTASVHTHKAVNIGLQRKYKYRKQSLCWCLTWGLLFQLRSSSHICLGQVYWGRTLHHCQIYQVLHTPKINI